jgi:serine/threonine protein phosphatase PrpC
MESTNVELIDGKYTLGQKSVVGDPRRKWEDRTFVGRIERGSDVPLIVGIVADGVGSADNGARGAELAIQTVVNKLKGRIFHT